jgi:hypothetical protein
MSRNEFFAKRWASRQRPPAFVNRNIRGPVARRRVKPLDPHLQQLLDEAAAPLLEGDADRAFALFRELMAHPALPDNAQGKVAGLFGWLLLVQEPGDPVPDEARRLLVVAATLAPAAYYTESLRAFILLQDGEAAASLRCTVAALRSGPTSNVGHRAELCCVQAAGFHDLGGDTLASRAREIAAALWPECKLLPWLEDRTTR